MIRGRAVLKTCKVRRSETSCCRNKLFHLAKFLLMHTWTTCILETLMQQNLSSIWKSLMHIHNYAKGDEKRINKNSICLKLGFTQNSVCHVNFFFSPFPELLNFSTWKKNSKNDMQSPFFNLFFGNFIFAFWKIWLTFKKQCSVTCKRFLVPKNILNFFKNLGVSHLLYGAPLSVPLQMVMQ